MKSLMKVAALLALSMPLFAGDMVGTTTTTTTGTTGTTVHTDCTMAKDPVACQTKMDECMKTVGATKESCMKTMQDEKMHQMKEMHNGTMNNVDSTTKTMQ